MKKKVTEKVTERQRGEESIKHSFISLFLGTFLLLGCQTGPDRPYSPRELQEGEWVAKAMIRDKKKRSTKYLKLEFLALRSRQVRVDIRATSLGIHLASLVMDGNQTKYLLSREKKFFYGPTGPQMMKTLTGQALHPEIFHSFLFDDPPDSNQWQCEMDSSNQLKSCRHLSETLEILWRKRRGNQRLILVKNPSVDLMMSLRLLGTRVQNKAQAFSLKPPRGYRVFQLK